MERAELNVVLKSEPSKLKYIAFGVLFLVGVVLTVQYHRQVNFSYSKDNCFRDITFLPKIFRSSGDGIYEISYDRKVSLKNYPLVSTKSCVVAINPPLEKSANKVHMKLFNVPLPNKKFNVQTEQYPILDLAVLDQKVSIRNPLVLKSDQADVVFKYQIHANGKSESCETFTSTIVCDVSSLTLKQNQSYDLKLVRTFNGKNSGQIAHRTIKTVEPVELVKTSVSNNQTVYDNPKQFSLSFNKPLAETKVSLKQVLADGKTADIESKTSINKSELIIKPSEPLKRKSNYQIVIADVISEDKGVLFKPINIGFSTSGGPKVLNTNIGTSSVEPDSPIVIKFDQVILPSQDIYSMVKMSGSESIPITLSVNGSSLTIKPKSKLPICAKFNISLLGSISNQYGISGDSAWSINSRNRCYTASTIGYSVQGRAITVYQFGSGSNKYVYFGTTHGDEKSTKYLMDRWVQEIDSNYDRLPANTTVYVIPNINPDGFRAGTRRNANGVDLNRNFPANDWKKDVTMPGGELVINGGGSSPLSEPESQAIANFVTGIGPKLVLTYHSVASIVSGNSVGLSDSWAQSYAGTSGYNYSAFGEEDNIFHYDTTGAFETWMHDKIGIPTILVELGSSTNSEFYLNRSAMWNVLN